MYSKYKDAVEEESIAAAAYDVQDVPVNSTSNSVNITRMLLSINADTIADGTSQGQGCIHLTRFPWTTIGACCVTWVAYIIAFYSLSTIRRCSTVYIVITVVLYPVLFVVMFVRMGYLTR